VIDEAKPESDQQGAHISTQFPSRRPVETALAEPRRYTAPRPPQGQDPGPRVHIGHIDIVVVAPQAPQPTSAPASSNLASRSYLRSL
jgi:hypothetical protein